MLTFSFFFVFVLFEEASLRCSATTSPSSSSAKKATATTLPSPFFFFLQRKKEKKKATTVPSTSFAELQLSCSAPYFFFVFVLFEEASLQRYNFSFFFFLFSFFFFFFFFFRCKKFKCLHFTVCCIIVFFAIVCCLKSLIAAIFRSLLALPDLQVEGHVEMVQASQQDPLWLLYGFCVFEILQTCLGHVQDPKVEAEQSHNSTKTGNHLPLFQPSKCSLGSRWTNFATDVMPLVWLENVINR
jgi:hypothetical protein